MDPHGGDTGADALVARLEALKAERRDLVAELAHTTERLDDATARLHVLQSTLEHEALHDRLTGLFNRPALHQMLTKSLARAARYGRDIGVLAIDVDGFRGMNDRYGEEVGDAVLVEVARRIAGSVREGDTAFRVGGDEFVVLAENVDDMDSVVVLASRLVDRLADPYGHHEASSGVAASVGGVVAGGHQTADGTLQAAEHLLAAAKAEGGRRWKVGPVSGRVVA